MSRECMNRRQIGGRDEAPIAGVIKLNIETKAAGSAAMIATLLIARPEEASEVSRQQ